MSKPKNAAARGERTLQYKSSAMAAVHEMMSDLHGAGVVDKTTMRRFDERCLAPVPQFTPAAIVGLREQEHVSQEVFARYLNVSKSVVTQWERGLKNPSGPALKLLSLVARKGLAAIA